MASPITDHKNEIFGSKDLCFLNPLITHGTVSICQMNTKSFPQAMHLPGIRCRVSTITTFWPYTPGRVAARAGLIKVVKEPKRRRMISLTPLGREVADHLAEIERLLKN